MRALPLLPLLASLAGPLPAQAPVRYATQGDTSWFQSHNTFTMYFVRGGDTLGRPASHLKVQRHAWTGPGALEIQSLLLDVGRAVTTESLSLAPAGRVRAINGRRPADTPRGMYDVLPRLPEPVRALGPGTAWTDTIAISGSTASGPVVYRAERRYRVTRLLDTLGVRALEIAGEGRLRYADSYWVDSAAGQTLSLDVEGPLSQRFWFDPARGRFLGQEWTMDLRGRGVLPGGRDTVPAGLRSSDIVRRIAPERASRLMRPLRGADTLVSTRDGAEVLLHVSGRSGDTVSAALATGDGKVGTATLLLGPGAVPSAFEVLWTDSTGTDRRVSLGIRGDSVLLDADGRTARDVVPPVPWAVADEGMDELAVPMLLRLPRDGEQRTVGLYRPLRDRWESATAQVRELASGFVALLQMDGDSVPTVLFIGRDGVLLASARGDRRRDETAPRRSGSHRAALERLIAEMRREGRP